VYKTGYCYTLKNISRHRVCPPPGSATPCIAGSTERWLRHCRVVIQFVHALDPFKRSCIISATYCSHKQTYSRLLVTLSQWC